MTLTLLPQPRTLRLTAGVLPLTPDRLILLDNAHPQTLRGAAARVQATLLSAHSLRWETVASPTTPAHLIALTLRLAPETVTQPQGYALMIEPNGITLTGHDEAGVFYGACTLAQIIEQSGPELPSLYIEDRPDFPVRGVMLDVSRNKVPTLETLYALVDMLAGWKINQLQLYTEHTFAYRRHPEVWAEASPFTGEDMLALDAFCRARQMELVPNQNTFGHMQRWLKLPRYQSLAEAPLGFDFPWGHHPGPFSLCPLDPGSLDLVTGLLDELLPHFTSRMMNVGCDETFDVGQGRSKAESERVGAGRVYLDFLLKIYDAVKARGHFMQYWGDIIVQHPDLIPELPQDAIALEWGYEADHPFAENSAKFAAAGLPFYVCPGTSSWNSIAGRTANTLSNLLNAAENGLRHGAIGYLNTDWGDNGHWQVLPVSYLGFAVGAAYSWALEANRALDVPSALSRHAFKDSSGVLGQVAYHLGNVYQAVEVVPHNASALFYILQRPLEEVQDDVEQIPADVIRRALETIETISAPLDKVRSQRPDAALLMREFTHVTHLLRHACRRALFAQQPSATLAADLAADLTALKAEFQSVWLARNRPGGLSDSLALFEQARVGYQNL